MTMTMHQNTKIATDTSNHKFHIAIATYDIEATVKDYSKRLGIAPCSFIIGEYALWRTQTLNVSVRQDKHYKSGELRHLGWEMPKHPNLAKKLM